MLYKQQEQLKGQGTKQQSQREGESETVTKGGSRKGIPLNEGYIEMRKEERGTIIGTSLRLSLGFSGFGFLWVKFLVFRVSLGISVKSSSAYHILYNICFSNHLTLPKHACYIYMIILI